MVPDLLDHLRAAFSPNAGTSYDRRFDEVRTAALLVLDDLGSQSATPWAKEKLHQLLNYRYNAELPTVITVAKESVEQHQVDERIITRMLDERICDYVMINAPAYQGKAKKRQKVIYPPIYTNLLKQTSRRINSTFGMFVLLDADER